MFHDRLAKLAPPPRPIRNKTKINYYYYYWDLHTLIFACLALVTFIPFKFCLFLFTSVMIGQSNFFGFGFMTLKWKLLSWNAYFIYQSKETFFYRSHKIYFNSECLLVSMRKTKFRKLKHKWWCNWCITIFNNQSVCRIWLQMLSLKWKHLVTR